MAETEVAGTGVPMAETAGADGPPAATPTPTGGGGGPAGDPGDAALVAAHRRASKRYNWMRGLYPLILFGVILGYLAAIASDVNAIDQDKLANALERKSGVLEPVLEEHLAKLGEELAPVYERELELQMTKVEPKATRLVDEQMTKLMDEAPIRFERDITKMLQAQEQKQRSVLVEHVPALKGNPAAQDRVLESVRGSLLKWCMNQLNTTLHRHLLAMEDIRRTLKTDFAKYSKGPRPPPEDAFELWLEVSNETLGGDSTLMDKPKDPGGKPRTGKPADAPKDPQAPLKSEKVRDSFEKAAGLPAGDGKAPTKTDSKPARGGK